MKSTSRLCYGAWLAICLPAALAPLSAVARATVDVPAPIAPDAHTSTVGLPARIEELVLPGAELEVAPSDANCPLVLRITAVSPHGTAFRYDLEFTGLDPGEYDLRAFLHRRDGSPIDAQLDLPPIPVTIRSVLPAGQIKPHAPSARDVPSFGGYGVLLIMGGVLWAAGLAALLFAGRQRKRAAAEAHARPRTLAERLQPLVERALAGTLSRFERAQLELGLMAYWRRRLGLEDRAPQEVLALMRDHADAGPLLRSLEAWLHEPASPTVGARSSSAASVDIRALLAPYRDLPADAIPDALSESIESPARTRT